MNLPKNFFTAGWLCLLLVFGVLEGLAILDSDTGDTFSEYAWGILDLHPFFWVVGLGFFTWLFDHFLFKDGLSTTIRRRLSSGKR